MNTPFAVSGPRPRSAFRLVVDPTFGPFFWGKLLWTTGVWVHSVVAAILVFDLTGSTLLVGATGAAQFGPQLLFSPLAGKLADRGSPVAQILMGESLCGAGSAVLAIWILFAGGADQLPSAWPVVGCSLIVGLGLALGGPAVQSIVPSLLKPRELAAGIELNTLPLTVSRVTGPALGAIVVTQAGASTAFLVAAAGSLCFVALVCLARIPKQLKPAQGTDFSMRAALRYLRTDRPLIMLLVGVAAVGFGVDPSTTLAPALAHSLDGGAALVGRITSAFGIGAGGGFILVSLLRARLGLGRLPASGLLLIVIGLVGAAASAYEPVTIVVFGIAGVGMTMALTSLSTQIHQRTPDEMRGRIMALWMMGFLGSRPLAGLASGYLSDHLSVPAALLATAALVLVAAWLCRPSRIALRTR